MSIVMIRINHFIVIVVISIIIIITIINVIANFNIIIIMYVIITVMSQRHVKAQKYHFYVKVLSEIAY